MSRIEGGGGGGGNPINNNMAFKHTHLNQIYLSDKHTGTCLGKREGTYTHRNGRGEGIWLGIRVE